MSVQPLTRPTTEAVTLYARAAAVAAVAAEHAKSVDRDSRFPREAMDEARRQGLLGILVPRDLGGEGAAISEAAEVCYTLGRGCSSTAMIYAMHLVKLASIVNHGRGNAWQEAVMRRVAIEQLLLASSTTEGTAGGNVRASEAPIVREGDRITLDRNATCVSYGAEADGIVTTARRAPDASASDQVLAVFLKSDYKLTPTVTWDTLGMRGTASVGYRVQASGVVDQILPEPYEYIHVRSMVPCAHILWTSAWAGVAADAVERARQFVRNVARKSGGQLPPGAAHLTRATNTLRSLRALITSAARRYEAAGNDRSVFQGLEFQTAIALHKVEASELAISAVLDATKAAGLEGYRNDSELSLGRHVRDILSSRIMIHNDRILANVGASTMMIPTSATLAG